MKQRLLSVLVLLVLGSMAALAQGPRITVLLNGQPVNFDQPPILLGSRVVVPLRGVFQQLGATVVYNPANRSISAQKDQTAISLSIGSHTAYIAGQPSQLDVAPILVGGRALVPLRFLSQALGARVAWHPERYLVTVDLMAAEAVAPPPPQPTPPPQNYGPVIQRVELSAHGLLAGQTLRVRMWGVPGGQAHFDVGYVRDVPMVEDRPGHYEGAYTCRVEDHERAAPVIAHLHLPNGQRGRLEGPWRVALGGVPFGYPPPPMARPGYLIRSLTHNGQRPLYAGQILEVTMTGAPGGYATFRVGNAHDLPMQEVSPGNYVGQYTVPPGPPAQAVPVESRLRLPNGAQQVRRAANVQFIGGSGPGPVPGQE